VAVGWAFASPPQSGLAWLGFLFPLIEPDRRSYCIRLSMSLATPGCVQKLQTALNAQACAFRRLKSPNIYRAPSEPVFESDPNCVHVRTRLPAHSVAELNRCRELLKLVCLLPEVTFIPGHTEFSLGTANRNVCRRTESVEEDRFGAAPCPPVLDRKSRAHATDGRDSPSALDEHLA